MIPTMRQPSFLGSALPRLQPMLPEDDMLYPNLMGPSMPMSRPGTPDPWPTKPSTSTYPAPVSDGAAGPVRLGGLGGLGGEPAAAPAARSSFGLPDGLGDFISAAGMSLMSSPSTAPLSAFPTVYSGLQDRRMQQEKVEWERSEKAGKTNATMAFLREKHPDLVPLAEAGMVNEAITEAFRRQKGAEQPTTDDIREYNYARLQGYGGSFIEYMKGMKTAGATSVNVGGAEKGYDKTVGEGYGKRFLDLQDQAQAAQRALNALDVMEGSLGESGFYSGVGADTVATLKRFGASLGMDTDGISSMETFNAMSKQAALDAMGGSLGTGFSNADRDFVVDQVPNLGNTPEGNLQLVGIQRKLNGRKQAIAHLARQYAAGNGGRLDAGFDDYIAQWAEQNPLFPPVPKKRAPGVAAPIQSQQDYDALPSGSLFIDPDDGKTYRKP